MPERLSALDAIHQRRSIRDFTGARVDRDAITTLLRAAIHAPTAMHLEPWAFVVVQDRALLHRLSDRAKSLALTLAPPGSELRSLARAPSRAPAMLADPAYDVFHGAGTLIVICGTRTGPFVAADCWLAAENLMIAATALGLGTRPIGFAVPALADPEMKRELAIPDEAAAIAPIVVGVPGGAPPPQQRREPLILAWKD